MRNWIRRFQRDERGMTFVFVGLGFMAFMAATTLAIDVGMFMTARSQAQNSADAGALAGAVALAFNDFDDRSSTGPAVKSAISAARGNLMMGAPPSVIPADVTFPNDPSGQPTRVAVQVFRTTARGNAIPTLIGPLFRVPTVSIGASATAEVSPANAMTCVKPFMIPDKWRDVSPNGVFNLGTDVYVPATDKVNYTGYTVQRDTGTPLVLRAGTGDQINPSFYFSWKMPGDVGGNFYRENIATCNQSIIHWNDTIIQEPGDKSGPTIQGINDLIAKDPGATWDSTCNCVKGSIFTGQSPRVFPIPLYDPEFYAEGKANGRPADFRVANFLGFFASYVSGNKIYGIITTVVGLVDNTSAAAPDGAFPIVIRLVQ
jgi:Flp pilus assembly protein TadG